MIPFIIGLFVGGTVGCFATACCAAAKMGDCDEQ